MNTKFAMLAALGTLGLMAAAPQAQAADNGFYLGAGATKTDFKFSVDGVSGSETLDDNSFKVIVGFRPLDWLAVEANYIDLGTAEFDAGSETLDTRAITASVLLLKEFQIIDIYARAGLVKWDSDYNQTSSGSVSEDGTEPTYGLGIGVHFGSVGARLEYERFETDLLDDLATNEISTLSLSVTYTFL
jgi:hypothetical protein